MTYIENIFLCLALPMLLSLLFTSGSPRRFTLFVVLGMATCLLSAYVSSFFMGRHQCSAVTTAIEIAPVCEEILKLLPLLLYFLIFEPGSHKLTPAAIGIAVGFATFENVCYLTENGAEVLFSCSSAACPPGPCIWSAAARPVWRWPMCSAVRGSPAPARWGCWGSAWCCTASTIC